MITNIIIIIILAFGVVVGFKQGLFSSLITLIGLIIILTLSFLLKNPFSVFLYGMLPFFDFGGITMLNLVLYEFIAFFIVFGILSLIFSMLFRTLSFLEEMMNATIIFGVPTKLLGGIVGFVEGYILAFVILYVLSLPSFNVGFLNEESKLKDWVLYKTPILASMADTTLTVFKDFDELRLQYAETPNPEAMNLATLDLFLKYKITTVESMDKLVEKKKIEINNIESVLKKYRTN